ncbi:hypothetical protein D3C85_1822780 [compost metagenome]
MIRQLSDTGDLLIDIFSHMTLLLGCRCHLLAHLGDPADGLTDANQRRLHRLYMLHALAGNLFTPAGCRYCAIGTDMQ